MDYYLTDKRWALIASLLPGKESDPGCHARDNRLFVEAVFWIARTGKPWRSLPDPFGKWYTQYTRFHRWKQKQVWPEVLSALAADESCEYFYEEGAVRHAPQTPFVGREAAESPPEAQISSEAAASAPSRPKKREYPALAQLKSRHRRERILRRLSRGKWQPQFIQPR